MTSYIWKLRHTDGTVEPVSIRSIVKQTCQGYFSRCSDFQLIMSRAEHGAASSVGFLLQPLQNRSQPSRLTRSVGGWTSLQQSCPALDIPLAYTAQRFTWNRSAVQCSFVLVNMTFCTYSDIFDEKGVFVYRAPFILIYVSLVSIAVWHRKWALNLCLLVS